MNSYFKNYPFTDGFITIKSILRLQSTQSLRLFLSLFFFFILGNFSDIQATNTYQVPAKAKVANTTPIVVKPIAKSKKNKGKGKNKRAIKKDSVVVDIDPTSTNAPLFEKHL
jgi:hypothetical protein